MWSTSFLLYYVVLSTARDQVRGCPEDAPRRAQQCFADLASGVGGPSGDSNTAVDDVSVPPDSSVGGQGLDMQQQATHGMGNAMPLDYRKIREYCAEDGQMKTFVRCVDDLMLQCPDLPRDGALRQLINPERVRTSVPNLCNRVDDVEKGSLCINSEMNRRSACKERAYDLIKTGMVQNASNMTAMFTLQCRFIRVLAECQRKAVTVACGGNLGDLHADFLLSFVPNTCHNTSSFDADFQQGQSMASERTRGSGQDQPRLQNSRGVSPQDKLPDGRVSKDGAKLSEMSKMSDTSPKGSSNDAVSELQNHGSFQEQVLVTLPSSTANGDMTSSPSELSPEKGGIQSAAFSCWVERTHSIGACFLSALIIISFFLR